MGVPEPPKPKRRPSLQFKSPLLQGANTLPEDLEPSPLAASLRLRVARPTTLHPAALPESNSEPRIASGVSSAIPATSSTMVATRPSQMAARALSGARSKGINFTTVLESIERIYGADASKRVRDETPGELGQALRYGGLVVGGWYPMEWYQDLWQSVAAVLAIDEAAARVIGHGSAEIGVHKVYRMFSRLASPAMLLKVAASAFNGYYDTGKLHVRAEGRTCLVAEWSGCTGFNSLIWHDTLGGAGYFVESTGVTGVKLTLVGGGGDQDWMSAEARWR